MKKEKGIEKWNIERLKMKENKGYRVMGYWKGRKGGKKEKKNWKKIKRGKRWRKRELM